MACNRSPFYESEKKMKYLFCSAFFVLAAAGSLLAAEDKTSAADLPKSKQTALGLYVTAQQAYDKWQSDPKLVKILDVRTPEEYVFVGHAPMALNIPLLLVRHQWMPEGNAMAMSPNPNFMGQVKERLAPTDTILITCRSGGRSARAVNMLAEAGFKNVYTIVDGFEGDTCTDPQDPQKGKRTLNGWKNAGLPWTYDLDRSLMSLPTEQ
jgi:rhodanese-related sulfurtransferase